jgi:hypothetical protein
VSRARRPVALGGMMVTLAVSATLFTLAAACWTPPVLF